MYVEKNNIIVSDALEAQVNITETLMRVFNLNSLYNIENNKLEIVKHIKISLVANNNNL